MELEKDKLGRRIDRWISGALFAALFGYVWLQIQPELIYYTFGTYSDYPTFDATTAFFRLSLSLSGGLVAYLGAFLSQTFIVSWLGAVVIVLMGWLLYSGILALPLSLGANLKRITGFAAVILAVMIWQQYDHPMNLVLGLAVNLWASAILLQYRPRLTVVRIILFASSMAVLYWWTGAISIVFGILMVIDILVGTRRMVEGFLCSILGAAIMWYLGRWVFCLEPWEIWAIQTPFHLSMVSEMKQLSRWWSGGLLGLIPAIYLMGLLFRMWSHHWNPANHPTRPNNKTRQQFTWRIAVIRLCLPWFFLIFVSAAGVDYSRRTNFESFTHPLILQAENSIRNRQWQEVVDAAAQLKHRGFFHTTAIYDINRALFHTGQLGDRLFEFPQDIQALLYFNVKTAREEMEFDKFSDMMLELGFLNSAEHYATEILEMHGDCPFILQRLSVIARAKDQDATAEIIEGALHRQPAYWLAIRLRTDNRMIFDTERFETSPQRYQSISPTRNHELREISLENLLLDLLADRPKNRMAFDYLMAYYLLNLQQDKVVENLGRLRDLGYTHLPRHYAEAALIHMNKTRQPIDLRGWTMDPEVVKQYQGFMQRVKEFRGDRRTAAAALADDFGNSYFFYSMFHLSGVGK